MTDIVSLLGDEAETLLGHRCNTIFKDMLHLPGVDYVDRVIASKDRTPGVLRSTQTLFDTGRLGGTGYLSMLPVDQGVEHSGGASSGAGDLAQAVGIAVINKRAGGMGLISGRKAFQRPMGERVELLHAIQDVYLSDQVTIA